jgi:hypothetical protein
MAAAVKGRDQRNRSAGVGKCGIGNKRRRGGGWDLGKEHAVDQRESLCNAHRSIVYAAASRFGKTGLLGRGSKKAWGECPTTPLAFLPGF